MDHQVAHDDIERSRIEGQVTGARVHEIHPGGDPFKLGIALGGEQQHRTTTTADVEDMLVSA
jgi:hypothetical protein